MGPDGGVPLGIQVLAKIPLLNRMTRQQKTYCHQFNVLLLTFLSYAAYHIARKPTSVVKNVLHHKNCSLLLPAPSGVNVTEQNVDSWCDWKPFDQGNADTLLGAIDSVFLFTYAFGMYFTGQLAERSDLRYFLSFGMILSGCFSFLFGVAYWADIHSIGFFFTIQIFAGFFQSTGWPGCVAAVTHWFGKNKRGFIMGVWRSQHSIGNLVGAVLAAEFVEYDWGLSFAIPAAIVVGLGVLIFFFLVPYPASVGCPQPSHAHIFEVNRDKITGEIQLNTIELSDPNKEESTAIPPDDGIVVHNKAISFWKALKIPGVIEYSLALFFSKLINYTFLYWLPRYIKELGLDLGDKASADLSALFDFGGIFGGIFAGLISDLTGMSAVTCSCAIIITFPTLALYQIYGSVSTSVNMGLLFLVGLLVNVPYALITTSVSADLGTQHHLNSERALATVTAIVDGTGSIGAAIGPLMAGYLSFYGWDYVFYVLFIANGLALAFLTRLLVHEIRNFIAQRRPVVQRTFQPK